MTQENKQYDLAKIEKLIEIMKENDLIEVQIEQDDEKIVLKRAQPQQPASMPVTAAALQPAATLQPVARDEKVVTPQAADELVEIKSPLVGTFYATASPDAEPYVQAGSRVDSQTVVCVIEAMKVMNEIKAGLSGTILEVLAASGQAVEYSQPLFKVKPD